MMVLMLAKVGVLARIQGRRGTEEMQEGEGVKGEGRILEGERSLREIGCGRVGHMLNFGRLNL